MIYIFDHNEDLTAVLKASEVLDAKSTETLDGFTRLDLEVSLTALDKMSGAEFVAHKDVNDENSFLMYKLVTAENTMESLRYVAVNIAFDDLKAYGYLREHRMEKTTAPLALDVILKGSRWLPGTTEQTGQANLYIYDLSRLEALQKLIKTFGVDLNFRVTIKGNRITGRYVDLYQKRGTDTGLRYYYGKNALDVVREESRQDIFTAVIGRGKGEEKFDSEGESTGGFGRRINFKDVEWTKGAPVQEDDPMYGVYETYPLDKPLGDEHLELKEATKEHGYSDGTARYKIMVHDQITEPRALLWACYEDLLSGARPLVHFKSTVDQAGSLNLGDRVRVIREDLDIYYSARVFKVTRDLLDPLNTKIELGDDLEHKQGLKNKSFTDSLGSLNERVSEVATSTQYTFNQVIEDMREGLENSYYNNDGYNYELKTGNKYGLPAGYYSFNAPIDENPSKVIYMGAGMMAIANRKKSDGTWDWQTFGTGDGLLAETIIGTLGEFARVNANQINVSDDFSQTDLGKKLVIQDELYNNIKITGAKGLQVLDAQQRERVQLGNWSPGRYGLKLTDATGRTTVLDDRGMLQLWQVSDAENTDVNYPLKLSVYIPQETADIYKAELNIYTSSFRTYQRGVESGGFQRVFESSGGGRSNIQTYTGFGDNVKSGGAGSHNHGIDARSRFVFKDGYESRSDSWIESGDHNHPLSIYLDSHTHRIDFNIDPHSHGMDNRVYEIHSNARYTIRVNGTTRTQALTGGSSFQNDVTGIDVSPYLRKGQRNIIEIGSTDIGRVDANVFIAGLMNYGGY